MRTETRQSRYLRKKDSARLFDVGYGTVNLLHEANSSLLLRNAACFGFSRVSIIGTTPEHRIDRAVSGSTHTITPTRVYRSEEEYLEASKDKFLVAIELTNDSIPLSELVFPKDRSIELFTGHESLGVPGVICEKADVIVHIPMPGTGFCLNTIMASAIVSYEYLRQINES